jgi:sigma-B regulation protein RsbU (phosphoserine phosphatase)
VRFWDAPSRTRTLPPLPPLIPRDLSQASRLHYLPRMPKILIADDQYEILLALKLLLKHEGFETVMASSPDAVVTEAQRQPFDLILIDLNYTRDTTSGREGLDLITQLRQMPHAAPVIVMTAWSTVPLAVEAMRNGAADFVEKPWENKRLMSILRLHLRPEPRRHQGLEVSADLEIARAVQNRLLPQNWPQLGTLDYAVKYQPAGHVGGDYFDFLPAGDRSLVFVVADVSGKGISAAILMATIQSFFRSRSPEEFLSLRDLLDSLNTLFYRSSPAEHYATLFVMRYDEHSRRIAWINCGHTPPLLCRNGRSEELGASATVLGMFPTWTGEVRHSRLDAHDTLLICSDGLTEAANLTDEEFGVDRLVQTVQSFDHKSPLELVESLASQIGEHSHGHLTDDLTILAIRGVIGADLWKQVGDLPGVSHSRDITTI